VVRREAGKSVEAQSEARRGEDLGLSNVGSQPVARSPQPAAVRAGPPSVGAEQRAK